jgi:hypothetical protein
MCGAELTVAGEGSGVRRILARGWGSNARNGGNGFREVSRSWCELAGKRFWARNERSERGEMVDLYGHGMWHSVEGEGGGGPVLSGTERRRAARGSAERVSEGGDSGTAEVWWATLSRGEREGGS